MKMTARTETRCVATTYIGIAESVYRLYYANPVSLLYSHATGCCQSINTRTRTCGDDNDIVIRMIIIRMIIFACIRCTRLACSNALMKLNGATGFQPLVYIFFFFHCSVSFVVSFRGLAILQVSRITLSKKPHV